jgi:hypothetical protein
MQSAIRISPKSPDRWLGLGASDASVIPGERHLDLLRLGFGKPLILHEKIREIADFLGEGIRTLDPNLGKVSVAPFREFPKV